MTPPQLHHKGVVVCVRGYKGRRGERHRIIIKLQTERREIELVAFANQREIVYRQREREGGRKEGREGRREIELDRKSEKDRD
jgi:hypothetical protein